jgi:RNA-directed DNA polymerase
MTAIGSTVKTVAIGTGAPSHAERMWLQADWGILKEDVKRFQVRIAKETMEGRWGKVKALQHLLTPTHSGKMLAVKRSVATAATPSRWTPAIKSIFVPRKIS